MGEAIDIRFHRARSWQEKAKRAAADDDLDAQFIFLWIAFNALYGSPRYLWNRDDGYSRETEDFTMFWGEAERLSRGRVSTCLGRFELEVQRILSNPFLNIGMLEEVGQRW